MKTTFLENTLFNLNHAIMKKTYIVFAALAAIALFATSCVKDIEPTPEVGTPEEKPEVTPSDKSVITAAFPEFIETKVDLEETSTGMDLKWEEDDFLTIVGTTTQIFTIASISEDGKTATFTGTPVEGDSFKVILSEKGEDYLSRSFRAEERPDNGEDMSDKLKYDAVLENVKDYTNVSFTQEWAEANGATFSQTGCMLLYVQLPEGCTDIDYAKIIAPGLYFSTTNQPNCEKTHHRDVRFNLTQNPTDGKLKVYCTTSMSEDVVPAGTTIHLQLETKGNAYFKDYTFQNDFKIMPGKRNIIQLNSANWMTSPGSSWANDDKLNNWNATYVNICASAFGPAWIIDKWTWGTKKENADGTVTYTQENNSLWQYPWNNNYILDSSFNDWVYNIDNQPLYRAPMVAIFNLKKVNYVHTIELVKRYVGNRNAKMTTNGEVWFSIDESNDDELGSHLTQNLKNGLTNDLIDGDWTKWRSKKWYKVGDFKFADADQTTVVRPGGAKAKYLMIVLHEGSTNNGMPVLCLTDMNLRTFNPVSMQ